MRVSLSVFLLALTVSVSGTPVAQTIPPGRTFRVTLLGTGTPAPSLDRFGPSTLVEVGNQRLLF